MDMWPAAWELTGVHSRKPGGKRGPTATQNGHQERSNPTLAVRLVDGENKAAKPQHLGTAQAGVWARWSQKRTPWPVAKRALREEA